MRQYRERRNARSTAAARRGLALLVVAAAVIGCARSEEAPPPAAPAMALPESVLLAEHAPPFYSLQESSDGRNWIAVFADAADLTLRLARGSLAAPRAHADEVVTIDRVDLVPGINPYFGRHAYLQHDGIEHLFYTDQELADARVTKWVYRSADSADPWTVDLLPEPVVPVGVLPASAHDPDHPGFTLFGLLTDNGEQPVLAYEVLPNLLEEQSAPIRPQDWSLPADAAPAGAAGAPGPALSPFHCSGRRGLSMYDHAGLLVVEAGRGSFRVDLPGREPELPPLPQSVACSSTELLTVAYARDDATAREDSEAAAPGAYEIAAVDVDRNGAAVSERKITLARDVRALALFPVRRQGGAAPAALTVLFSELAMGDSGAPEHRLALVMPDADGSYRKLILARGSEPVQDARALRAGSRLAVLFRRAGQLRILVTELAPPAAGGGSQSAGSW